eukprot:bmy_13791T0
MLHSEMMKTNLILKGKDAEYCAHPLHILIHVWSQLSPREPCCKILSCHVDPDFLATWVCLMPDKSDRGTVSEEFPTYAIIFSSLPFLTLYFFFVTRFYFYYSINYRSHKTPGAFVLFLTLVPLSSALGSTRAVVQGSSSPSPHSHADLGCSHSWDVLQRQEDSLRPHCAGGPPACLCQCLWRCRGAAGAGKSPSVLIWEDVPLSCSQNTPEVPLHLVALLAALSSSDCCQPKKDLAGPRSHLARTSLHLESPDVKQAVLRGTGRPKQDPILSSGLGSGYRSSWERVQSQAQGAALFAGWVRRMKLQRPPGPSFPGSGGQGGQGGWAVARSAGFDPGRVFCLPRSREEEGKLSRVYVF